MGKGQVNREPWLSLWLIKVIHAAKPKDKLQATSRVLTMVLILELEMGPSPFKRARWEEECLGFLGKDTKGII